MKKHFDKPKSYEEVKAYAEAKAGLEHYKTELKKALIQKNKDDIYQIKRHIILLKTIMKINQP